MKGEVSTPQNMVSNHITSQRNRTFELRICILTGADLMPWRGACYGVYYYLFTEDIVKSLLSGFQYTTIKSIYVTERLRFLSLL